MKEGGVAGVTCVFVVCVCVCVCVWVCVVSTRMGCVVVWEWCVGGCCLSYDCHWCSMSQKRRLTMVVWVNAMYGLPLLLLLQCHVLHVVQA